MGALETLQTLWKERAEKSKAGTGGKSKKVRIHPWRLWCLVGGLGFSLGMGLGILFTKGSLFPEMGLAFALGVAAFGLSSLVERAWHVASVPKSAQAYGEEVHHVLHGLLDSSLHTAQWRHAAAGLLERAPREFVETLLLGSEVGYVMEREYWLRAEEMGLVAPVCWAAKSVATLPRAAALSSCENGQEPILVDVSPLAEEAPPVPLLTVSTSAPAPAGEPDRSTSSGTYRASFVLRNGKLVPSERHRA